MSNISLDQKEGYVWHNGEYVELKESKVHILTHSLHYASSIFEGCRIYNGKVFKLNEHIERLFKSADLMKIKIPFSRQEIINACEELVRKNNLTFGYMRPLVWYGSQSMKIVPTTNKVECMVACWDTQTGKSTMIDKKAGLRLVLSNWIKPSEKMQPVHAKASCNYGTMILAKADAFEQGFDDVLMLDQYGYIAESSVANVFFVKENTLYTPTTKYALEGITRRSVISIANSLSIPVIEGDFPIEFLNDTEGFFLTGTAIEIAPVESINVSGKEIKFTDTEIADAITKEFYKIVQAL